MSKGVKYFKVFEFKNGYFPEEYSIEQAQMHVTKKIHKKNILEMLTTNDIAIEGVYFKPKYEEVEVGWFKKRKVKRYKGAEVGVYFHSDISREKQIRAQCMLAGYSKGVVDGRAG